MPANRRWLNPDTHDYVVERGAPRADATATQLVLIRFSMRRGSCPLPGLEKLGSRFHEITKNGPGVERRAIDFAFEALDDLIRTRIIRDVTISAEVEGSRLGVSAEFYDTDDDLRTVSYTHQIG